MKKPRILSVFVDECGDFGFPGKNQYALTFIFHDQSYLLTKRFSTLDSLIKVKGIKSGYFHAGPLIRSEEEYYLHDLDDRRAIFDLMLSFVKPLKINYCCCLVDKTKLISKTEFINKLKKPILKTINNNLEWFLSYDKVIVYYDGGQDEVSNLIKEVFTTKCQNVEFRDIVPKNYKLFQVADFISTVEFTAYKYKMSIQKRCDIRFFGKEMNYKQFKEKYIDSLKDKVI